MDALIKEYKTVYGIYSAKLREFGLPAPKAHSEAVLRTLSMLQYERLRHEIQTMRHSVSVMRRECSVCRMIAKYGLLPITVVGLLVVLLNALP